MSPIEVVSGNAGSIRISGLTIFVTSDDSPPYSVDFEEVRE
jgi:hypothetical protein